MRILRVIPLLLTIALIWLLDHPFGSLPALGRLLDPVNGAMAAAEPVAQDFNKTLKLKDLQAPVAVWLEDRLVPHIRAENDHDLYYAQGYIHAYFRLWQMDLQTRAAGGRLSEVVGPRTIEFDRGQRRKGMVWGAQRSLSAMERDPRTKLMVDAYRDGINAYIRTLDYASLPIEYKLMGFYPEEWTNLRTALMAKNLADDLTSKTDDIAFTLLRDQLGQEQFDFLFPERIRGSKPVIPEGTPFAKPSLPVPTYPGDSVWAHFGVVKRETSDVRRERGGVNNKVDRPSSLQLPIANCQLPVTSSEPADGAAKGSNNWAISGAHTASGKPILCNDPHLSLNLPSLWFEMQLTAPGLNAYGASLPGAPGIVIGFNQKISWGFTNNYRDVKDFYEIRPTTAFLSDSLEGKRVLLGALPTTYVWEQGTLPFERSVEVIKVKGRKEVIDTVLYTLHGPVLHDPSFPDPANSGKVLACTWMAHRASNELLATYLLNRAADYPAFTQAIQHFECPAQNIAYADGAGNIAMWGQGRFINKWKGQGRYVMRGDDSATLWGDAIPMAENPHVLNPPQGYVASANQQVTDSTYPYWYNGSFVEWRSWEINFSLNPGVLPIHKLAIYEQMQGKYYSISPRGSCGFRRPRPANDFEKYSSLQNSNYSAWNDCLEFVLESAVDSSLWSRFFHQGSVGISNELDANKTAATKFQVWSWFFYKGIWGDEFAGPVYKWPSTERTLRLLQDEAAPWWITKDGKKVLQDNFNSKYYDDKTTQQVETLSDIVQRAIKEATDSLDKLTKAGSTGQRVNESTSQQVNDSTSPLAWYKVKNTTLTHLARIPAFSYPGLKIGGWSNTINALTGNHGPSWRMIVEMDSIPKAYTVYPGGQSGNPGSPHYGDFVGHWVKGKYFTIQFLTAATTKNPFKYTWTLTP